VILVISPSKGMSSNPYLAGSDFPSGVSFPVVFHSTSTAAMSFLMDLPTCYIDVIVKGISFRTDLNGNS